jgi:hypothetical protein
MPPPSVLAQPACLSRIIPVARSHAYKRAEWTRINFQTSLSAVLRQCSGGTFREKSRSESIRNKSLNACTSSSSLRLALESQVVMCSSTRIIIYEYSPHQSAVVKRPSASCRLLHIRVVESPAQAANCRCQLNSTPFRARPEDVPYRVPSLER